MDNEKNKVEYNNTLDFITNEYHDYNEYNKLNIQDGKYKEFTSFKEYNDNKSSLRAKRMSRTFMKLLSSAMVITLAVIVGTEFIFSPKSKISEVFIEGYDNNLFISVLFSEYDSDDNLELVIKNDFTNRVYKIEPFEEGNEEEKQYIYFLDVNDLKSLTSYNISVVSGANILYSQKYVIEESNEVVTRVNMLDAMYEDDLIFVNIEFSDFSSEDYVLLQLQRDDLVLESIGISEVVQDGMYYYDNSFSVVDNGNYYINLYINNNLEVSKLVKVENIITSVAELGYEYGDLTFNYYFDFNTYSDDEDIMVALYQDDILIGSSIVSDINNEGNYYTASGEIENIIDGIYIVKVTANGEEIYSKELIIGYIYDTVIEEVSVNNENNNCYLDISFSGYSEEELIEIEIYKDDKFISKYTVDEIIQDGLYIFSNEFEIDEYGIYDFRILINGGMVYEDSFSLVYNVASSIVSNVQIISFVKNILVIVDMGEYDESEDLSIYLTSNHGYDKSLDLEIHESPTGLVYSTVYDNGGYSNSNFSYIVYANGTAEVSSGTIVYQSTPYIPVSTKHMYDHDDNPPYILLSVDENEYNWSYLIFNKNGNEYPVLVDASDYFEGTLLYVSLDGYENGDYCFILFENDGTATEPQIWSNFTIE